MPVENLEDEGLPKNPNLELAAWRFTLNNPEGKDKEDAKKRLMDAIKENGMFCALSSRSLDHMLNEHFDVMHKLCGKQNLLLFMCQASRQSRKLPRKEIFLLID